jgi:hypothetical protein
MMNPIANPLLTPMNVLNPNDSGDCGCNSGPRRHKVPRMPIMIDDAKANPMDVRSFVGKPLHTVVDDDALDGKMLQIFTSNDMAESFARSSLLSAKSKRQAATPEPTLTPGITPGQGYIDLFEHIDFGGCEWHIPENSNNGTVGRYADLWCGILWWAKNADNRVSSADVAVSADLVVFFDLEGINLIGGSATLLVPGNAWIPSLVPFGWNDRISSHLLLTTQQ